jgi:2,4-dienoyl-CoA reductase-like NADH-dependent reductase (Old Yellow Enzyme family)
MQGRNILKQNKGETEMSELFERSEINGMELSNRFVRSATWEGMAAEDGACTPKLMKLMADLAEGGVGLIISSHAYIMENGQAGPWQIGVYKDELVEGLRKMTQAVKEHGSRSVLQISHAGFFANPKLIGQTPLALSAVEGFSKSPRKVMTEEEIGNIVGAFGQAARRAKEAGFDGVQIHAAHGYLLSQSLSPAFNKREDSYGGDLENRARFMMEVLREVRSVVGTDFPVLVKMNSEDCLEDGLILEDSVQFGAMLEEKGIDAIELSGGTFLSGKLSPSRGKINSEEREAYFREAAKLFKEKINIPLILVGGNRSVEMAEKLLNDGYADYISMSRPFIREPGLIKRWSSGDLQPAACLSDNQCFGPAMAGQGILCVVEKKEKEKE